MLKTRRWLFLCSACAVLPGCISAYSLRPTPTVEQNATIKDGYEIVSSKKTHIVMVAPKSAVVRDSRQKFGVDVMVKNMASAPFNVYTSSITGEFNGAPLQAYTAEEVIAEIEKRQRIAAALSAVGGALSAASAQQSASRVRQSGYVSGYNNSGQYVSGNYTASGYDPAAGQAAASAVNARTDRDIANIRAAGAAQVAQYSGKSFNNHTLAPDEWYGGTVYFDAISPSDEKGTVKIKVDVAGEIHEFALGVSLLKK